MARTAVRTTAFPSRLAATALFVTLAGGMASPAASQEPAAQPSVGVEALAEQAHAAEGGMAFASAVAALVKLAHEQPAQGPAVVVALTPFVRGDDALRRAITVDALQNLPPRSRESMVPVLAELAQARGEGPAARLFVRGLAEAAAPGRAALQRLVASGALRGDALALARMYLRG